jgi:hypothetical protein
MLRIGTGSRWEDKHPPVPSLHRSPKALCRLLATHQAARLLTRTGASSRPQSLGIEGKLHHVSRGPYKGFAQALARRVGGPTGPTMTKMLGLRRLRREPATSRAMRNRVSVLRLCAAPGALGGRCPQASPIATPARACRTKGKKFQWILERDGYVCYHCGGKRVSRSWRSLMGAALGESNAVASCLTCNFRRGAALKPREVGERFLVVSLASARGRQMARRAVIPPTSSGPRAAAQSRLLGDSQWLVAFHTMQRV